MHTEEKYKRLGPVARTTIVELGVVSGRQALFACSEHTVGHWAQLGSMGRLTNRILHSFSSHFVVAR